MNSTVSPSPATPGVTTTTTRPTIGHEGNVELFINPSTCSLFYPHTSGFSSKRFFKVNFNGISENLLIDNGGYLSKSKNQNDKSYRETKYVNIMDLKQCINLDVHL